MSEQIQRLIDRRANVWEGLKATLDGAENEKRDLTTEEQTGFDQRSADLASLDQRIQGLIEAEQRQKDIADSFRTVNSREERRDIREDGPQGESVGAQLRKMFSGQLRSFDVKPATTSVDTAETRALSKLTAGAGGNLVYPTFYDRLFEYLIETASLVNVAQVIRTATGEPIVMPKVTSLGTAALVAELGTIPQSDPAFGQATLSAYKYGDLLQLSHELANDTGFDLEGFIARQAGRAVGNAFGADLMTGNGTAKPTGLLNGITVGKTGSTGVAGAFTIDDLIDLKYSVISPYRARANVGWMLRDASVGALRKLKDTTGRYLWEPGLQVGAPNRFDGDPVYTEINVPAIGVNNTSVLYGDFSAYTVRLVETLRFEASADFAFNTDAITYRCLLRGDGMLLDTTGAIKAFKGAAT